MNSFTFVSTFLTDLEKLPYETRCKVIDAICYWGVYKQLPSEVEGDPVILALLSNPQRMIEGQEKYKEEKSIAGKKGGRAAALSDEEIIGAYVELYKKNGRKATEKEVIDFCGANVSRIAMRKV